MSVIIGDATTRTITNFTIIKGGPFDASNPADLNSLITNGAFDTITTATGLELMSVTASSNNPGSTTSATLTVTGTAQVVPGVATSSHIFKVTILTTQTFFTNPPGTIGTLSGSQAASITNTIGSPRDSQGFQSFYDPMDAPFGMEDSSPPVSFPIPASASVPLSLFSPPETTDIEPYTTPYSLTNRLVFTITGNNATSNAKDEFGGATSLTVASEVPEPPSFALFGLGTLGVGAAWGWRRRRQAGSAGMRSTT
jgi:hypothetical protein